MVILKPDLLLRDVANNISSAWQAVTNIESESLRTGDQSDYYNEGYDFSNLELESYIKSIYVSLIVLYEYLGYQSSLQRLQQDFDEVSKERLDASCYAPSSWRARQ